MALLLELLEVAGLELPRELRETEHRKALQGVPDEGYGWDLPLASSDALSDLREWTQGDSNPCIYTSIRTCAKGCLRVPG